MEIAAKNLTDAWHWIMTKFQVGHGVEVNKFRGDVFLNVFDILILTRSHKTPGICLEDIGYTPKKLDHLIRTYINTAQLGPWVRQIWETEQAYGQCDSDVLLRTTDNSRHTNGPCLLGFSYRSRGGKTLTVYSRSADFPIVFAADCLLVSALAEIVGRGDKVKIRWYLAGARIRSRMANYYRAYLGIQQQRGKDRHPSVFTHPPNYLDPDFQAHITAGWEKFIEEEREASFIKLQRLQDLAKMASGVTPLAPTKTGVRSFVEVMRNIIGEGSNDE